MTKAVKLVAIAWTLCIVGCSDVAESDNSKFQRPVPSVTTPSNGSDAAVPGSLDQRMDPQVCGNGLVENGEACDDGNQNEGDGCSALCMLEAPPPRCGNGQLDQGESCDDSNQEDGDGCSSNCTIEALENVCGDGLRGPSEACDDGNNNDGDGCSAQCIIEPPPSRCGDGRLTMDEECDDGNLLDSDGCSSTCMVEVDLSIPPRLSAILDDIPGYAEETIGGRDGTLYEVTSLANAGPGTLREAAESEAPLWIVFQDGLNGTIRLESQLSVKSYKTIDARGHQITLQGVRDDSHNDFEDGWHDTGVTLGQPNDQETEIRDVVFINLVFDGGWPHADRDGAGADGIHLHNRVTNVWVHQCTFHNWIDGAIDARNDDGFEEFPQNISITSSHFYDIHEGLLLEARRVTFARNHCDNLGSRCVKTIDGGSVHMVNNVIRNWSQREIIFAKNDSRILIDHNIFDPGNNSERAGRVEGSGDIQDVHNVRYRGDVYRLQDRGSVHPDFKRDAQAIYGSERRINCEHDPVDDNCWADLYDDVVNAAGASIHNL